MNARIPSAFLRRALGAAALTALLASAAYAEDFHGFDPANFDGAMLSADQLKAMVADATAAHKPNNGKDLVIGFANLQRDVSFCLKVENGILDNAKAAGVEMQVADNRLDGATALANAESFLQRQVDYVIEFQTDANFGATIMQKMNDASTKVVAIDIPMPGATFFGANNPRSGFMGGAYLGQAAIAKFGADKVKTGYFVVGELPQSGAIPAMRTGGQVAGFEAAVPGFPADHIIKIDTKNTLEESFTQMNNVIGRIPDGAPIMVTAINDQAATGMMRAVKQAGREADLIVVGMGADELQTMVDEPSFVASVGYFPERYGNYLIPLALMELAGKSVPDTVLVNHVMVTKDNICKFYDKFACTEGKDPIKFEFPQPAFEQHLAEIRKLPDLADYQNLIPTN
ncbi:sugar ABC transporter substrate-binding protein [Kaistia dalseonensis]|uniref:Ribose transport system substrate-binding protein n=1 Tax=Kaistia dalseonensis TaxID=410840 RepID=A0ABU0H8L1_9HYPH|nr:sugar ABC transporter substrate-binding protein [Kaistia dalseonensis]MCX5496026.1 sugar ABC transporter substrate-binding protein [Kaistia dalseonensis]MDQ0438630.1 ribose transport system substrate-binding protein [Kaistia dalseonensis]